MRNTCLPPRLDMIGQPMVLRCWYVLLFRADDRAWNQRSHWRRSALPNPHCWTPWKVL